ncbi:uncharacterized protein LOC132312507 [Cornus florida]|uniref:uncharacterized protein LOC132312507 n=1 Tax=Cornus florida TaxID=4283 RepID=UPI00289E7F5B|nr:uncharacterized protein LOC132312507 [Cornus florida]
MSIGLIHQFVFFDRNDLSKSLSKRKPFGLQKTNMLRFDFIPKASAASVSGSGAEYSEQLLGAKPKKKRQRIAGIDQDELVDPAVLADPDSCFCEFKGVQIHHKICDPESPSQGMFHDPTSSQTPYQIRKESLPMILLHGFGASVFSWDRVMKPLAHFTGSKVLAFDRPAFGLTSRVNSSAYSSPASDDRKPLNPYSTMFSVLATLHFINFLTAKKAILVGHSAGSIVAVQTYFEAPERVAALVLVAPAIIAPRTAHKVARGSQFRTDNEIQEEGSNSKIHGNPFIRLGNFLSEFSKLIAQAIMRLVKGMVDMVNSLYKKALSALLRSAVAVMLIRMVIDKFGIAAIRNSWYDANQITDNVLNGYTKPLRTKDWDRALVEYTAAMLTDSASESKPPLVKRLGDISCPVLIVTGDSDRLVPSWNSERLSRAIPGASLEIIKNCGHLPQEERVEEFVSIVEKFLERVFGGLEEQCLRAAT